MGGRIGCGNAGAGQATAGARAPESWPATRTESTDASSTAWAPCVQAQRHRPDLQQSEACFPVAGTGAGMAAGDASSGVACAWRAWHGMSTAVAESPARAASASTASAICTDTAAAATPLTASIRLSSTRSRSDQTDMRAFYRPTRRAWPRPGKRHRTAAHNATVKSTWLVADGRSPLRHGRIGSRFAAVAPSSRILLA
jgi:hypothetical protein